MVFAFFGDAAETTIEIVSASAWLCHALGMPDVMEFDVVVVGGGAAGLMAAAIAGARGRRVALIEHNERVGKKIEISGGGRCNFTNLDASPNQYLSECPDFCKSALSRYSPQDFVDLVEKHGIRYHEKKLGQLFCDGSSREIIELLVAECREAGVTIFCKTSVHSVSHSTGFRLESSAGTFRCSSLIVATGGLSFAKLGATDWGHSLAKQFGLGVTPLRPGLVPLTLSREALEHFGSLSGVALPVRASHRGMEFPEALLFTHRGLSGPAVLQISSYRQGNELPTFDLMPGEDASHFLESHRSSSALLSNLLSNKWPRRLAETWCAMEGLEKPVRQISGKQLKDLAQNITKWSPPVVGTEGYPKAEVTLGGVDVRGLTSKTMEARNVPGLFFVGEVMDVTGWLGGYNFQWAWASGYAAGNHA